MALLILGSGRYDAIFSLMLLVYPALDRLVEEAELVGAVGCLVGLYATHVVPSAPRTLASAGGS